MAEVLRKRCPNCSGNMYLLSNKLHCKGCGHEELSEPQKELEQLRIQNYALMNDLDQKKKELKIIEKEYLQAAGILGRQKMELDEAKQLMEWMISLPGLWPDVKDKLVRYLERLVR